MSVKKHKILDKRGSFTNWYPENGPHSLHLSLKDYKVFHKISRTVHLEDYREIEARKDITPKKLHPNSHSYLSTLNENCNVVWYGIHDPHADANFYGNVSYVVDINNLLSHFRSDINIYFVEVTDFKASNASRILLTRKAYDSLPIYNPRLYGGPWYIDPSGKHFHLCQARRYDGTTKTFGHRLEFMLEFEKDDYEWLYKESTPFAVDHREANSRKRHKCLKYGVKGSCPTPYDREQTEEVISSQGAAGENIEKTQSHEHLQEKKRGLHALQQVTSNSAS